MTKIQSHVILVLPNVTIKCVKNKGTIKCDKSIITCDAGTVQYDDGIVKCEKTDKGTIECEKSTDKFDVSTA